MTFLGLNTQCISKSERNDSFFLITFHFYYSKSTILTKNGGILIIKTWIMEKSWYPSFETAFTITQ